MAFFELTLATLTLIEPILARIIFIEHFLPELCFFGKLRRSEEKEEYEIKVLTEKIERQSNILNDCIEQSYDFWDYFIQRCCCNGIKVYPTRNWDVKQRARNLENNLKKILSPKPIAKNDILLTLFVIIFFLPKHSGLMWSSTYSLTFSDA